MKRLVLILGLVLLLALAACDTMGPTPQEVLPTDGTAAATQETPQELPTDAPSGGAPTGEQPEGETASPGADLQGVTWEWVSLIDPMGQTTSNDPTRYTITFNADGMAPVVADCNNVINSYITDGVNLEILPGPTTLMACPEGSQDQLFINSLTAAEAYVVQDGELFLTLSGGTSTMIFRPATLTGSGEQPAAPSLTGTTWEWVEATTSLETITVVDPTRYTITFNEDGTANIKADCNSVMATYTADDAGALTLTLGPSTLMACPPDSQVDAFLAGLGVAGAYSFAEGELLLINPAADGGVLRFRAAGTAEAPTSPDAELTDIVWEWVSTTTAAEEITAADPTRYRITFNADGTAGLTADCNVGNAAYTVGEDGSMTITLGISTLAFCVDSQDTIFREGLAAAASYAVSEGDLVINLANDAGTMRFRNGGPAEEPTEPPAADSLTGTTWEWVKTVTPVEEVVATDQTRYNIVFNADGTASIKADCNTGFANYTTGEGGAITITPGGMTLVMCPDDSQATRFMADLTGAAVYFFQDGNLFIDLFASSGTMQFAPAAIGEGDAPIKGEDIIVNAPRADMAGTSWQLTTIQKRDGNITINDPTRYAITFNVDGTANITADCNTVIAAYTIGAGNLLTITPGPSTMAYCGPGSLDQIFVGGLTNAMGYRLEDGNLLIDMLYESGSLVFKPAN